jgi:hypothetical protein
MIWAAVAIDSFAVIAGLDPAINLLSKRPCAEGWMPGSSPGMTLRLGARVLRFPIQFSNSQQNLFSQRSAAPVF